MLQWNKILTPFWVRRVINYSVNVSTLSALFNVCKRNILQPNNLPSNFVSKSRQDAKYRYFWIYFLRILFFKWMMWGLIVLCETKRKICTLRSEKSVLCEMRNLYFAKWEICTLRSEKSVLCEMRNLYFAKWEICTMQNEKSVLNEVRNLYFAKWEICTLRNEKSVLCEMRNLYLTKWGICTLRSEKSVFSLKYKGNKC